MSAYGRSGQPGKLYYNHKDLQKFCLHLKPKQGAIHDGTWRTMLLFYVKKAKYIPPAHIAAYPCSRV